MTRKCQVFQTQLSHSRHKNMQHKSANITWNYWKCPRHPVTAKNLETRGINTIILYYCYRVDPELGKGIL